MAWCFPFAIVAAVGLAGGGTAVIEKFDGSHETIRPYGWTAPVARSSGARKARPHGARPARVLTGEVCWDTRGWFPAVGGGYGSGELGGFGGYGWPGGYAHVGSGSSVDVVSAGGIGTAEDAVNSGGGNGDQGTPGFDFPDISTGGMTPDKAQDVPEPAGVGFVVFGLIMMLGWRKRV